MNLYEQNLIKLAKVLAYSILFMPLHHARELVESHNGRTIDGGYVHHILHSLGGNSYRLIRCYITPITGETINCYCDINGDKEYEQV